MYVCVFANVLCVSSADPTARASWDASNNGTATAAASAAVYDDASAPGDARGNADNMALYDDASASALPENIVHQNGKWGTAGGPAKSAGATTVYDDASAPGGASSVYHDASSAGGEAVYAEASALATRGVSHGAEISSADMMESYDPDNEGGGVHAVTDEGLYGNIDDNGSTMGV